MTEKRYKLKSDEFLMRTIFDTFEEIEMGAEYATDILNAYEEEIERLKKEKEADAKCYGILLKKYDKLKVENEKIKHENELLSDELKQCKAVINKEWSKYLKKRELHE